MRKRSRSRYRQNAGYASGSVVGFVAVFVLLLPSQEKLRTRGPINVGHEELTCQACHQQAPGSLRQQVQANVKYLLGWRSSPADFGRRKADNAVCLSCHERPNDNHPVFRFLEPRFEEARKTIRPHVCTSCHLEHTGKRVTAELTICAQCHRDTKLKSDPITVSHEELIAAENWQSCLGCHDWHGNHVMELNTVVETAIEPDRIARYFEGGPSPYPDARFYPAKKEIVSE